MSEHRPSFFSTPAKFRAWLKAHRATAAHLWVLFAIIGLHSACASSPEARSARHSRRNVSQIQKRLEKLSQEVVGPGDYSDADVRQWIDSMPGSVVEQMIPEKGYVRARETRPDEIACRLTDLYRDGSKCARHFVGVLRAYRSAWGKGSSSFSAPEWAQIGDTITVTFDRYELVFDSESLELTVVNE